MSNKKALKYGNTSEQKLDQHSKNNHNTNNWPYELYI